MRIKNISLTKIFLAVMFGVMAAGCSTPLTAQGERRMFFVKGNGEGMAYYCYRMDAETRVALDCVPVALLGDKFSELHLGASDTWGIIANDSH